MTILIVWFSFVSAIYFFAWIDDLYYTHDLPAQFRHMRRELFEES